MSARVVKTFVQPRSLADAELDHRVAMADARDAYDEAVARATAELMKAQDRADRMLAAAKERQRSADLHVANLRAYYRERPQALLEEDLERFRFQAGPDFGVLRERKLREQVEQHIGLISAEIARRAADVS